MSDSAIAWDQFDFNEEKMPVNGWDSGASKENDSIKFKSCPITYRTVDNRGEEKEIEYVQVAFPEVTTERGVSIGSYQGKAPNGSIGLVFDLANNEEHIAFVGREMSVTEYKALPAERKKEAGFLRRLKYECILRGDKAKLRQGMTLQVWDSPMGFNDKLKVSPDGKTATYYFTLACYASKGDITQTAKRARFVLPYDNKEGYVSTSWESLENKSFSLKPIINVNDFFLGQTGGLTIRMGLHSAVVLSEPLEAAPRVDQLNVIELSRQNKELLAKLAKFHLAEKEKEQAIVPAKAATPVTPAPTKAVTPAPAETEKETDDEPQAEEQPPVKTSGRVSRSTPVKGSSKLPTSGSRPVLRGGLTEG